MLTDASLARALKGLNSIKKSDLIELRAVRCPTDLSKIIFDAV